MPCSFVQLYQQTPANARLYPCKFRDVTLEWKSRELRAIKSQSLITPATFMVRAEVLPMSKKTDRFNANAHAAFAPSIIGATVSSPAKNPFQSISASNTDHGINRKKPEAGAT